MINMVSIEKYKSRNFREKVLRRSGDSCAHLPAYLQIMMIITDLLLSAYGIIGYRFITLLLGFCLGGSVGCSVRLETRRSWVQTHAEVGNILSWRLIMKYFLLSFSPFRWFKKGSCQFLAKECAQYWLTA